MADRNSEMKKLNKNTTKEKKKKSNRSLKFEDYFSKELVLKGDITDFKSHIANLKNYSLQLVKSNISTTQLRNIFTLINSIENYQEIWKEAPKLAYLAGRNESNYAFKEFIDMLIDLITEINSEDDLKNLKKFLEAIVAYHKYNEKFNKRRN